MIIVYSVVLPSPLIVFFLIFFCELIWSLFWTQTDLHLFHGGVSLSDQTIRTTLIIIDVTMFWEKIWREPVGSHGYWISPLSSQTPSRKMKIFDDLRSSNDRYDQSSLSDKDLERKSLMIEQARREVQSLVVFNEAVIKNMFLTRVNTFRSVSQSTSWRDVMPSPPPSKSWGCLKGECEGDSTSEDFESIQGWSYGIHLRYVAALMSSPKRLLDWKKTE